MKNKGRENQCGDIVDGLKGFAKLLKRKQNLLSANISNMSESVLSDIETLIERLSIEDVWECFV